jgi:uncharacterized membrane protein YhaH (DUF805 family)
MKKNFNNQNFEWLFQDITSSMPKIIFTGIILTYLITAALNVYFLPLPLMLSIPASLMLQFGRFAIVFIDFLNPSDKRSKYPPRVAAVATFIALLELWFSIQGKTTGAEFWAMFLFIGAIICFGYVLEIQFIEKGIEAYGIGVKEPRKRNPPKPKESALKMNATTSQPIKFTMAICFMFCIYVLPAQNNHFFAYNTMSVEKIDKGLLERRYYSDADESYTVDTITYDLLSGIDLWDGYSRTTYDNTMFMTYGTQNFEYFPLAGVWKYKNKYYDYIELLKFVSKYFKRNFLNKKITYGKIRRH